MILKTITFMKAARSLVLGGRRGRSLVVWPLYLGVLIAVLGVASVALLKNSEQLSHAAEAEKHTDADLKAGPVEYRIPWQYLPSVTRYNPKNGYAAFTLAMLLPDFRGAALDHDEFARVGWHNQLTALFEFNRPVISSEKWTQEASLTGESSDNEDANHMPGCKFYLAQIWAIGDMFICDQKRVPDHGIVVFCTRLSVGTYPYCKVAININSYLSV